MINEMLQKDIDSKEILLEPPKGWFNLRLNEVCWEFRELFYFLTWRDIKVRYKQTFLGIAWAIIQPLTTMVVFTIIFGRLAKLPIRWYSISYIFICCSSALATFFKRFK